MIIEMSQIGNMSWGASPEYGQAKAHIEAGRWSEAAALLHELLDRYPGEPRLQTMLAEVQLRQETEQAHVVRARRFVLPSRGVIFAVLLLAVLLGGVWVARTFYVRLITPSMQLAQAAQDQDALAAQATQALAAADYPRALEIYDQLAELNPNYDGIQAGRDAAKKAMSLEDQYSLAMQQLANEQWAEAQATLTGIQQAAPTYRDVNTHLARLERRQRLQGLLNQADEAQNAGALEEVVMRLEEARAISPAEDLDSIEARLFEAYVALGSQIADRCQGQPAELRQAVDLFTRALALQPQEVQASTRRQWARQYLNGYDAFTAARWDDAIAQLEPLYAAQPAYAHGAAAQLLYDAYVHSAQENLALEETTLAWERYHRASQLKGPDTGGAQAMAATLGTQMTPTAGPTAVGTAARTPTPRVVVPAGIAAAGTPAPRTAALGAQRNRIAYWSDCSGTRELWVMDADGQNAFKPEDQQRAESDYQRLRTTEMRSPDGTAVLSVFQPEGETAPAAFISNNNGPLVRLTTVSGATYDPVWAPTGHWVAFASNSDGNDEIYLIGRNGAGLTRLTKNTWEVDRHPSWSPDGDKLVFWSNRAAGHGQIWTMNADGTEETRLTNNECEEQDPLWIK